MADEIVPRWEWRTFGERLADAESHFAGLEPERVRESDETYLLSLHSDTSIKVRDAQMVMKELEHVGEGGLEQWKPTMKAGFPLSADEVRAVLSALRAVEAPLERDEYTLEQLIEELVRPSPDVLAIDVHKERAHYTIDGCMTELSEIRVEQGSRR